MNTVSQLSRELEWILDDYPRQIERRVGFVKRSTAQLDGSRFVRTLVLGWAHEAEASYSQLTAVANSMGPAVSPQAVEQRFSQASVTLLKTVLQEAGRYLLTSQCRVPELLARFQGVYLQDGSVISLPDAFAERYPGAGGSSPEAGRSSLRIQVRWDIAQGGIDGLWVQAGREAEGKGEAQNLALPKGSLFIGDIQYLSFPEMREREAQGGYWLTPARANTVLFDEAGVRFDLISFLQRQGQAGFLDWPSAGWSHGAAVMSLGGHETPRAGGQRATALCPKTSQRRAALSARAEEIAERTKKTHAGATHQVFASAPTLR